jgi:hypothetical protein
MKLDFYVRFIQINKDCMCMEIYYNLAFLQDSVLFRVRFKQVLLYIYLFSWYWIMLMVQWLYDNVNGSMIIW